MHESEHTAIVDHLFRQEHGKMVAVLTRIFGFGQIDLIEDVVQDAFVSALRSWRTQYPDNPSAWLMRVAKNRAIDLLRKGKLEVTGSSGVDAAAAVVSANELFHESEIADSQLRLIFACCHLVLEERDQIAFTLFLASGFGTREIAAALLTKPETIKKRLQRARKRIRTNATDLSIPSGNELIARRQAVLKVLYLLFNEGYRSSTSQETIRRDLCAEAMRLTKLVSEHPVTNCDDSNALLALMCYHAARFESRMTEDNQVILLADQDRSTWDRELIGVGNHYFAKASMDAEAPSTYVIEAAIAAQHAYSPSYGETRWDHLLTLYNTLYRINPSPLVKLNKLIVLSEHGDVAGAVSGLEELSSTSFPGNEQLYHCASARLLERAGKSSDAKEHLERALEYASRESDRELIQSRIDSATTSQGV